MQQPIYLAGVLEIYTFSKTLKAVPAIQVLPMLWRIFIGVLEESNESRTISINQWSHLFSGCKLCCFGIIWKTHRRNICMCSDCWLECCQTKYTVLLFYTHGNYLSLLYISKEAKRRYRSSSDNFVWRNSQGHRNLSRVIHVSRSFVRRHSQFILWR